MERHNLQTFFGLFSQWRFQIEGLKTNFTEIPDTKRTQEEKAELLTRAAVDSVTQEIYAKELDGIHYLADNMGAGVLTVLTRIYCQAILDRAGNTHNLQQAHIFITQKKRIAL
ncbi:MAG TPA: hypothetical protein PK538_09880 [Flexilinea sp.]|jgi:hypothetical protein|nr:hypothetical protein [Flexilinea sp.]